MNSDNISESCKDYILVYTNASRENPVSIDMFDLSGRKMTTHQSLDQVYRIQTNHIQAGTYYLKINNGKNAIVTKFVIAN
ncbi:MAG: T9SS type A sorting domain-containing protein [Saprospiraceae bacterium]|nr:T9SS type A sorting domain-containing protein [Saprospiraceae bacterium]